MLAFITGPLLWFSCIFFVAGCLVRLAFPNLTIPTAKLFGKIQVRHKTDSWQAPNAKKKSANGSDPVPLSLPVWILVLLIVILPLFYLGHAELISMHWDLNWPSLPRTYGDVLAVAALGATILAALGLFRLPGPGAPGKTTVFCLMLFFALPFFTGLMARYRMPGYDIWMISHIVLGEALLVAIPCSGLFKILFFFLPARRPETSEDDA